MTRKAAEFPAVNYGRKTPRQGEVVCHNFPPGLPNRRHGDWGFRFWTMRREELPENFARCRCEWPVEEHYCPGGRIRPIGDVAA